MDGVVIQKRRVTFGGPLQLFGCRLRPWVQNL